MLRGVHVGHRERSSAAIFPTPDGVKRGEGFARMLEHARWDREFSATCIGVPWQLSPKQRQLLRSVVPVAEADQGFAPVIVMLRHERSMDIPTSVKHARRLQQACTMRRFLTTTDAEIAWASSWQKMTIRDKVIESHHEQSQRLKFRVQKPDQLPRIKGWITK